VYFPTQGVFCVSLFLHRWEKKNAPVEEKKSAPVDRGKKVEEERLEEKTRYFLTATS
jgi:hypothetical protein